MALHNGVFGVGAGVGVGVGVAPSADSPPTATVPDDPLSLSSPSKPQPPLDTFSSPASTPLTISFDSAPFLTLAEQSFTPLSIVDDSYDIPDHSSGSGAVGEVGGGKPTEGMGQSTTLQRIPLGADSGVWARDVASAVSAHAFPDAGGAETHVAAGGRQQQQQQQQSFGLGRSHSQSHTDSHSLTSRGRYRNKHSRSENTDNTPASASAAARGHSKHEEGPAPSTSTALAGGLGPVQRRYSATRTVADTAPSSPKLALHGHAVHAQVGLGLDANAPAHDTLSSSPQSIDDFPPPLRTGSVQPDTQLAQPRPKPIVRTASDSAALAIKHPTPDLNVRSGAYLGNIAQLEATAERLSLTSSIEDAIRDLHCELKRSDSRRSSFLAARRANSADDNNSAAQASVAVGQIKRHLSTSSSIVSTNIAARHGGYSPAGYVMSPSHSLTGRLRSGSKNSSGRPELDFPSSLSRHGPGKASVRSVRSTKLSLAEISEMEPITLTQDVLDKADAQPPMKHDEHDSLLPPELKDANMPSTDMFRKMMGEEDFLAPIPRSSSGIADPSSHLLSHDDEPQRPGSSGSANTFQQCQDAFGDFDGVHWEPEHDEDPYVLPPPPEIPQPPTRMPVSSLPPRPQSYMDPESGQQMHFYPARVPAMLNLPPKLSNKPKATERINRRSQVLSAMMDGNRQSRMLGNKGSVPENARDSWLPDPLAGHRESFAALSSEQLNHSSETKSVHTDEQPPPVAQAQSEVIKVEAEPLRRPRRLSKMDSDKRMSRMSRLDNLPPQLRASAYFDIPPTAPPEIEVKDGSAMATLESILDASAHAPVSAFTDHNYAGKLGSEVYGKEKKRASMAPSAVLRPSSEGKDHQEKGHHKRGSSFMWLGRRHSHASLKDDRISESDDDDQLGDVDANARAHEQDALAGSDTSSSHVIRVGVEPAEGEEVEEEEEEVDEYASEEEDFHGPPTTLLAELQLRKQRQKQRTQNHFPNGMHATLLEMDAVAETERKHRKTKRVNLAWEDGDGQLGDEDSEDEDVPLAIIAARNQGAKNVMDLNRPLGLMERRELEDNEPLSQRRARLTSQDPRSLMINKRPSNMNLSATSHGAYPLPSPREAPLEPEEAEVEGETLADRKRRLAAKEDGDNPLPKTRPVSTVFTAELLSQFGDPEERKKEEEEKAKAAQANQGEETLGQRRRRLQAEREAREHEMSFNNLQETPQNAPVPGIYNRRMNMSDVLSAHPKKESDIRAEEERRRMELENRLAREQEAKMAAMRSQMPTSIVGPNLQRSGGYQSGAFNDGTGGQGPEAARSSPAVHAHMFAPNYQNRQNPVASPYGGGPVQNPYGSMVNLGAMNNKPGYGVGYGSMNNLNPYGGNMSVYGGGMMQPGMQMPINGGSMDRVEQWRQSIQP